jgi:Zn-dependent protease with chaperone function
MFKQVLVSLVCFFTLNTYAAHFSKIVIKSNHQLKGQAQLKLTFHHGVLNKQVDELTIDQLQPNHEYELLTKKARQVRYELNLFSSLNNLHQQTSAVKITGRIKIKSGKIKKEKIEIENSKTKLKIKCDNIIDAYIEDYTLNLSLVDFVDLSSCQGQDIDYYTIDGIGKRRVDEGGNFFSMNEDISMGAQYASQFRSEYRSTLYDDNHPATRYLQHKMEEIAQVSDMPNLKPKISVINADVLNAFALPGGHIFVFRGLIERAPSEAALMGVLGHEWAHVTARHGTKNLTRSLKLIYSALTLRLALHIWGGLSRDRLKSVLLPLLGDASVIGAQLAVLHKGRQAELEADRLGSQYASLVGYHPTGIAQMFEEFKKARGSNATSLERILSSHPDHDTRIQENIMQANLFYPVRENYVVTSDDYFSMVESLKSMQANNASFSFDIGDKFINGLRKQQNDIITKEVEKYFKVSDEE